MGKFVYIYKGGELPEGEAEQQQVMAAWGAWFGVLGDAIVDPGNAFGGSKSIGNGGASGLGGYSIVTAGSLDAAVSQADGCPILERPNGSVEVYETIEM
jgi:hypothetical protein